jgi:signal transduction histidine kinase
MEITTTSIHMQVLYNLVGNAVNFTSAGSVRASVAPVKPGNQVLTAKLRLVSSVRMRWRRRHAQCAILCQQVEIIVADTGIGIPPHVLPHIWDASAIYTPNAMRKQVRTGLGLNIVQQLVHSHGGTIACESKEGVGTTFTIRLPVVQTSLPQQHKVGGCGHVSNNAYVLAQQYRTVEAVAWGS